MYYLKCDHCNALNEVKTEYQTFCNICNKKLVQNFSDWKKTNPNGTFDDFKLRVCLSEDTVRNTKIIKKKKPKAFKYWIGFSVTFLIFFGIVYSYSKLDKEGVFELIKAEISRYEVKEESWSLKHPSDLGLSLETPYELSPIKLPLPDEFEAILEQVNSFMVMSGVDFMIMTNSIKYKDLGIKFSIQAAADGAIKEMKSQAGVSQFDYTEEDDYNGDYMGIKQTGQYTKAGLDFSFYNVIFIKDRVMHQVTVAYKKDDEHLEASANRIISSIVLK